MQGERNTFKVILVGNGGSGKTNLARTLQGLDFDQRYIATLGVEVHPVRVRTNYGTYCLNLWDCAGQEKFAGLGQDYWAGSDATILCFDLADREAMERVHLQLGAIESVTGEIPFAVCGTKCDRGDRIPHAGVRGWFKSCDFYETSSKHRFGAWAPILFLLKCLLKKDDVVIL